LNNQYSMSFNDHIIDHFLRGSLSQPFGRLLHLNIQMSWGRSQPTIWPLVTFEYSNVLGAAQPIKNEELRTILGQPFLGRPNPSLPLPTRPASTPPLPPYPPYPPRTQTAGKHRLATGMAVFQRPFGLLLLFLWRLQSFR
jgi:hypothetical protein